MVWSPLYDDGYVCVMWKDAPKRRLSAESYAEMPHVFVAPRERAGGIVDEVLAARGLRRRIAVQVPTFLVVPHVLVGTDRIATIPTRMAERLCRDHPLRVVRAPIEVPGFTMSQAWHELHRGDPGHRWLREQVTRLARDV